LDATRVALAQRGIPNMTVQIDKLTPFTVGELIILFEVATVFTGYLMDINPFDQPGVELGKHFTYGIMGRKGFEGKKEEFYSFFNKSEKKYII
jgi:glucose-6-phosphate isomerase